MITSFPHGLHALFHLPLAEFSFHDPRFWVMQILPLAGMAIAAIAMIGGFIITDRNRRMRHETIRLALEKGQPVPETLFNEEEKLRHAKQHPRNDRRSGLILVALSAGIFLFFKGMGLIGLSWLATIPGFLGVALFINGLFERPDRQPPAN